MGEVRLDILVGAKDAGASSTVGSVSDQFKKLERSAWHRRQVALLEDVVELLAAIAEKLDIEVPEPVVITATPADPEPVVRRSRWARLWRR